MAMRNVIFLTVFLASAMVVAGSATATHDETQEAKDLVDQTLRDSGVGDRVDLSLDEGEANGDGAGPGTGAGGIAGGVLAAVTYAGEVAQQAGEGILTMGLGLVASIFTVFSTGGDTASAAFDSVMAQPMGSAGIAAFVVAATAGGLGLLGLIQRYGSLGAVPLFTRIAKSELLDNDVRAEIFELIKQNPGINVSEIARRLDIAWGTATHHLQKLRAERMIAIRRVANQKCYFQNGGSYTPQEMDVMSATKNQTAKRIAELLVKAGPHCHRDIAESLDVSPALVSFHMRKLLDAGVVAKEREGRRTIFSAVVDALTPEPRATAAH